MGSNNNYFNIFKKKLENAYGLNRYKHANI